jgi:acyl-CoA oxidase
MLHSYRSRGTTEK